MAKDILPDLTIASSAENLISPVDALNPSDPGDETQRNFRYQHAYGVILLIAGANGHKPYVAIWCEQHEDFLCERDDGLFDGYQIKTRKPEDGCWKLSSEGLYKSIARFVSLTTKFPKHIGSLFFVSNADLYSTESVNDISKSLPKLLSQVKANDSPKRLSSPYDQAFNKLLEHCECDALSLWNTLGKIDFIKGPSRDDFDAVIAHDHISTLPGCGSLSPTDLNTLRDELVSLIYRASSLQISDPRRHYYCLSDGSYTDPHLSKKRVSVEALSTLITDRKPMTFRYLPIESALDICSASHRPLVLERKLVKGGISDQLETMRRRALSTENHLMELAYRNPSGIEEIINQAVGVVKGECDEALLEAQLNGEPFGRRMLNSVYRRLRAISENRPRFICDLEYECLAGLVGILTAECQVWWSQHFDLEETP